MVKLRFVRHGIETEVPTGWELLQLFRIFPDLPLLFGCTEGRCGRCAIAIVDGGENLSKMTKQEKETLTRQKKLDCQEQHYRLACQCAIAGDVVIE